MIEALRTVRYTVGDLAQAEHWYSQWLDVLPYPISGGVLRYGVDGSWLELVEDPGQAAHRGVLAYWGVDSLGQELERLQALGIRPQTPPALADTHSPPTATFVDPFGNVVGLVEVHDPPRPTGPRTPRGRKNSPTQGAGCAGRPGRRRPATAQCEPAGARPGRGGTADRRICPVQNAAQPGAGRPHRAPHHRQEIGAATLVLGFSNAGQSATVEGIRSRRNADVQFFQTQRPY